VAGRVVSAEVTALTKGVLMNMALARLRSAVVAAAVLVVAAGAGWLTYHSLAAEPPTQLAAAPVRGEEPRKEDPAIVELQKKKLQAAEKAYDIKLQRVTGGTEVGDDMPGVSKLWLESERELDGTRDGRLKALRAHLERMKVLEVLVRQRMEAGVKLFTPANQALAEFALYEAEIWVRKAEAEKK
jgi:hypothetical protein